MKLDVVVASGAHLGECPTWDAASGRLMWVDITAREVHSTDPGTGHDRTFTVPEPVGALALRRSGGLVLAMESGFWTVGADGSQAERIVPIGADDSGVRMNDGKCDVLGRFWAGTMPYDHRSGVAALYRLDADQTVRPMVTGVSLSNGVGWSPDNRYMYYVDTPTQRVDVFDFEKESGDLSNRRTLFEVPIGSGLPDGLAVDTDGCIWLALWGGGAILRCTPEGRVDREIRVPVTHVTSCTFGGSNLDELYITSASIELSQSELASQPLAGAIFVCRAGAHGLPGNIWAG